MVDTEPQFREQVVDATDEDASEETYRAELRRCRALAAREGDLATASFAHTLLKELDGPSERFRHHWNGALGLALIALGAAWAKLGWPGAEVAAPALVIGGVGMCLRVGGIAVRELLGMIGSRESAE